MIQKQLDSSVIEYVANREFAYSKYYKNKVLVRSTGEYIDMKKAVTMLTHNCLIYCSVNLGYKPVTKGTGKMQLEALENIASLTVNDMKTNYKYNVKVKFFVDFFKRNKGKKISVNNIYQLYCKEVLTVTSSMFNRNLDAFLIDYSINHTFYNRWINKKIEIHNFQYNHFV